MEEAASEAQAEFKKLQEALASMSGLVAPADTPADDDDGRDDYDGPFVIPMPEPEAAEPAENDDGQTEPPSPKPEAAEVDAASWEPQPLQAQEPQPAVRRRPPEPLEPPAGQRRPPEPLGLPPWRPSSSPPWREQSKPVLPPTSKAYPSELPQTSKASGFALGSSSSSSAPPPQPEPKPRVRGERKGKNLVWYQGLREARELGREKQYREAHPQPQGDPVAREQQRRNIAAKRAKAKAGHRERSRSVSL